MLVQTSGELKEGRNYFDIVIGRKPSQLELSVVLNVEGSTAHASVIARVDKIGRNRECQRIENLLSTAAFKFGGEVEDTYHDCGKYLVKFWLPFDNVGKFMAKFAPISNTQQAEDQHDQQGQY